MYCRFAHCQEYVLPAIQRAYEEAVEAKSDMVGARKEHLQRWWQFWNRRDEMTQRLAGMNRYIGCSRVTRRPVMVFLSARICPKQDRRINVTTQGVPRWA
jgi:hypothetical protein